MLDLRFRESNIPRPTDAAAPDRLRDGAFNADPLCILRRKGAGSLTRPALLECIMVRSRTHRDRATLPIGTQRSLCTALAIPAGEFDHNRLIIARIDRWHPTAARLAGRTGHLLGLPIDRKIGRCKAVGFRRLAPIIAPDWTHKIQSGAVLTFDKEFRIDIAILRQ